jgi:hypothetical protein
MMPRMLRRLLLACLLLATPAPLPVASLGGALMGALAAASVLVAPDSASARTSGGYSTPGGGSFGGWSATRRPSIGGGGSGGYGLPSAGAYGGAAGSRSGGDQAISRQSGGDALRQYRAQTPAGGYDTGSRRPSTSYGGGATGYYGATGGTYAAPQYRGWAPTPAPLGYGWAQPGRGFGVWDGLMLWGLLNTLSSPGHAAFFYNNQDDPGYQAWRAQAEQASQQDAALRAKLADLDQRVADLQGQPKDPGALPPDVRATAPARSHGSAWVVAILCVAAAVFGLLWLARRRAAHMAGSRAPSAPAALRGSAAMRFRVGMTFPVDPTPFVLAAAATKVRGIDGGGMISVEAIGVMTDGAAALNRLYLPGREAFFLLHLGADGRADECRYFSRLDEVTPGSADEWGAWLDPAQGMIGWPRFQTKDGVLYDRVWNPGGARIAPRELTETVEDLQGVKTRKLSAMLYGRATGAAAPAPPTEYILLAAVEAGEQAFVEIHAGIDVNPASLSLPGVPLG